MANEASNPYLTQPNADEQPCALCGGTEEHDPRCPEMHRCKECFALIEGGEEHDSQCTEAWLAREERRSELADELVSIARAAAEVLS
jgi:hypothetical protein